jgi:hypothetical protein
MHWPDRVSQGMTLAYLSPSLSFPCKKGVSEVEAGVKVSAGDGLKRLRVSNRQEVVLPDVQSDGDVGGEVEVNWQRLKGE